MAHIQSADRVKETTNTTSTGTVSLDAAGGAFRRFGDVCANGDTIFYCIAHQSAAEWEVGLGTWGTGNTLARTTVLKSSNANAAVDFSSGTKDVFATVPADRTVMLDHQQAVRLPAVPSNPSAPPANTLSLYARKRAGRILPNIIGPSGIDSVLQPALFGNNVVLWLPGTGTTVGINFGEAWTARNSGTGAAQSHPTRASTNILTQMKRARFGTGTTATGSSGIQSTNLVAWRGNAAGLGGFYFFTRFGIDVAASDMQFMIGLSALNAALAGEPSAQNNSIVIGADSTDTNIQVIRRDGSTAAKTDVGVSKSTTGAVYDFHAFAPPNGSEITVRVVNAGSGAVLVDDVVLSSNLPVNTTFLYAHAQIRSTTGTTAKNLDVNRIYIESDT